MSILDYWPFESPPRDGQKETLQWLESSEAKYNILQAPVGCHLAGTHILMFDGTIKRVEDIVVGDKVMGPDSTCRKVLSTHSGTEPMFQISPFKGESFTVNENHILSLKTTKTRTQNRKYPSSNEWTGNETINISVKDYLTKSNHFKKNVKLYRTGPIEFDKSNQTSLQIDPYLLGLLLGDGTISYGQVAITTQDNEIVTELYKQASKHNMSVSVQKTNSNASTYKLISENIEYGHCKNTVKQELQSVGVYGSTSETKFIPHMYKTCSLQSRLQLLAGLIDSDGYVNNEIEYATCSEQLANDVAFVARSLGFLAVITQRTDKHRIVRINGNLESIPTRLIRKRCKTRKQNKRATVCGFNVIDHGVDNYYGFTVDKDHLYVLSDFTVTHNSGKSFTALTYSRWLQSFSTPEGHDPGAFIFTPQKVLQTQYERSTHDNQLVDLGSFYGRSNYRCTSKNCSCELGASLPPNCGENCTYNVAKMNARRATNTVMNYKLGITSFAFTTTFKPRQLLVLDECHNAEQVLIDFDLLTISYARCNKYNINYKVPESLDQALEWLEETYMEQLERAINQLHSRYRELFDKPGTELTQAQQQKLAEYTSLCNHYDDVTIMTLRKRQYVHDNFVLVTTPVSFQIKRLYGAYSFDNYLKPMADRFLLMSSTILNTQGFCHDLGIPYDQTSFFDLGSEIDPKQRPVYFMPQMNVNAIWNSNDKKDERKDLLNSVNKLLDMHQQHSGLIHTANFKIAEWLTEQLQDINTHQVFQHNPSSDDGRDEVIDAFINNNRPSVLISPSSTEGLDLTDDLARFAIFVKVPYEYLGDQWVDKRRQLSPRWYNQRALTHMIQGSGRIVRHANDWGNIYILDGNWKNLYNNSYHMIPQWWLDAYHKI